MGSGKSTVGNVLARRLGWEFVDLDREIEVRAGRSIPEIFEGEGEPGFRDLEESALSAALAAPNRVVACGGGIIARPANRERLRDVATVFLEEDLDLLYRRTRGRNRPLRGSDREAFGRRYAERLPYYLEVADLRIVVRGRTPEEVADEVVEGVARWPSA